MSRIDVLVVGAGPTGLSAACELARYGISFKIIDRHRDLSDQSKALAVQARTLEIFDRWGIGDRVAAAGSQARSIAMWHDGKVRVRIDVERAGEGLTRYPYVLVLPQPVTEEMLEERLAACNGSVMWGTELLHFKTSDDAVEVDVRHAQGQETWQVRYVIAADGASSFIRKSLGIPFQGGTYENQFFLADCDVEWGLPENELEIIPHDRGVLAFFPMGGTRYRVIGTLGAEFENRHEISFAEIQKDVAEHAGIPIQLTHCQWSSIYRIHHRCIDQFRYESVFFAGDAAHVHSPAGGQGMNTGIQDAVNISWKLAYVLKGWAMPDILNTYQADRHPFAERLVKSTDLAFKAIASPRRWAQITRRFLIPHVLPRLWAKPELRKELFRFVAQLATRYGESPLSQQHGEILPPGARVPDVHLPKLGRLYEVLRDGKWQLLAWGVEGKLLGEEWQHVVHEIPVSAETLGSIAKKPMRETGAVLVRPDGYAGLQMQPYARDTLERYLHQWLCPLQAPARGV